MRSTARPTDTVSTIWRGHVCLPPSNTAGKAQVSIDAIMTLATTLLIALGCDGLVLGFIC